ncbi:hypothetical protein DFP72DRAFT_1043778 [Ephemerocybe angulata]|uniref:Uncharacterized protein n=1 Tax=Ephemerocybe angulata TaxID=980116 RepID=A0A8H6M7Y9_9AGAR|nr:hypothetical protein DFP72DRAFT_1043778 [Tulosesus angulatus]
MPTIPSSSHSHLDVARRTQFYCVFVLRHHSHTSQHRVHELVIAQLRQSTSPHAVKLSGRISVAESGNLTRHVGHYPEGIFAHFSLGPQCAQQDHSDVASPCRRRHRLAGARRNDFCCDFVIPDHHTASTYPFSRLGGQHNEVHKHTLPVLEGQPPDGFSLRLRPKLPINVVGTSHQFPMARRTPIHTYIVIPHPPQRPGDEEVHICAAYDVTAPFTRRTQIYVYIVIPTPAIRRENSPLSSVARQRATPLSALCRTNQDACGDVTHVQRLRFSRKRTPWTSSVHPVTSERPLNWFVESDVRRGDGAEITSSWWEPSVPALILMLWVGRSRDVCKPRNEHTISPDAEGKCAGAPTVPPPIFQLGYHEYIWYIIEPPKSPLGAGATHKEISIQNSDLLLPVMECTVTAAAVTGEVAKSKPLQVKSLDL